MSVSYKTLNSPRQWSATTGLTKEKFKKLVNSFQISYIKIFGMELWERQNNSSTESHLKTYEDYVFFILFSLKSGLTYDALGFIFGMSGGNAKKVQHLGILILRESLKDLKMLPKRVFSNLEEFELAFSEEHLLIIDGTEQAIQRPVNQEDQQDMYSGKKNDIQSKQ